MDTSPDTPLGPLGDDSINVVPDVPLLLKPLETRTDPPFPTMAVVNLIMNYPNGSNELPTAVMTK
jgi:hypothetical protein